MARNAEHVEVRQLQKRFDVPGAEEEKMIGIWKSRICCEPVGANIAHISGLEDQNSIFGEPLPHGSEFSDRIGKMADDVAW